MAATSFPRFSPKFKGTTKEVKLEDLARSNRFGVVAAGSCKDTFAHTGDRVFGIMEIPTSALPSFDDGTISDWLDVVPESLLMTDFTSWIGVNRSFPPEIDPKDFTFRVFLAWHYRTQRILVALGRVDDE